MKTPIGICCRCGERRRIRNIAQLPYKGPNAGKGWGCCVCHLPPDGMVAIICDECFNKDCLEANLKFVCAGYALEPERVSWDDVKKSLVPHNHELAYHQDEC